MMNHTPPMSPGEPPQGLEARVARLELRVAALEVKVESVMETLKRLEPKIDRIMADQAEMKGRISQLPTWWMLLVAMAGFLLTALGLGATFVRLLR
jgi:uncharacterized coiled-coil protein SlyX